MSGYVRKRAQPVPPLPEESAQGRSRHTRRGAPSVEDVAGEPPRKKTAAEQPISPPDTAVKFKQLRRGPLPPPETASPPEGGSLMKLKRLRKGILATSQGEAPLASSEDETVKKLKRLRKDDAVTASGGDALLNSQQTLEVKPSEELILATAEDDAVAKLNQLREGDAVQPAEENIVQFESSHDEPTRLDEEETSEKPDHTDDPAEDESAEPDIVVKFKHIRKDTGVVEEEEPVRLFYSLEACQEEAKKYNTKREFQHKARDVYDVAKRNGWMDDICTHMKPPEKFLSWGHWNLENCRLEAQKYTTRIEFYKSCGSAYNSASRHNWLEEICAHMKPSNKLVKKGYWNLENCRLEALKYTRRKEFYKKCGSAYNSASRHGWLDEVCAHMHTDRKPSSTHTLAKASIADELDEIPVQDENKPVEESKNEEDREVQVTILAEDPQEDEDNEAQVELVLLKNQSPAKPKVKTSGKGAAKAKPKGKK